MGIIQHNPENPNDRITIDPENPSKLIVAPVAIPDGASEPLIIDLTPYQGGPFRLYVEADGSYSTDLYGDHYWLLAEAILPERQYDQQTTGQTDENGQNITITVERPVNLNDLQVTVFPLPEVE